MAVSRKVASSMLALLILVGTVMVLDQRFVSVSVFMREPVSALYLFGPSLLFAIAGTWHYRRGRLWPAFAFATGLFATGLFHQYVINLSDGNPGYMFPAGHIIAPIVSFVAYTLAFLVIWGISRLLRKKSEPPLEN